MKKILALFSALGLLSSSAISVVSCGVSSTNSQQIDNDSISRLEKEIEELKKQLNDYKNLVDELKTNLAEQNKIIASLINYRDLDETKMKELETKFEQNNQLVQSYEQRIANNESEITSLKNQVEANKTLIDKLTTDNLNNQENLENLKTDLENQITINKNSLEQLENKFNEQKTLYDGQISDLTTKISANEQKIKELEEQNSSSNDEAIKALKKELQDQIDSNTTKITDLETALSEQSAAYNLKLEQLDSLTKANQTLINELKENKVDQTTLTNLKTELENQINLNKSTIDELNTFKTKAETDIKNLQDENSSLKTNITDLQTKLDAANQNIDNLQATNDNLNNEIKEMNQTIYELKNRVDALEKVVDVDKITLPKSTFNNFSSTDLLPVNSTPEQIWEAFHNINQKIRFWSDLVYEVDEKNHILSVNVASNAIHYWDFSEPYRFTYYLEPDTRVQLNASDFINLTENDEDLLPNNATAEDVWNKFKEKNSSTDKYWNELDYQVDLTNHKLKITVNKYSAHYSPTSPAMEFNYYIKNS